MKKESMQHQGGERGKDCRKSWNEKRSDEQSCENNRTINGADTQMNHALANGASKKGESTQTSQTHIQVHTCLSV